MTHSHKKLHLGHLRRVSTPHVHFTAPQGFKNTPPSELHIQKQLANHNNEFHKVKTTHTHTHTHTPKLFNFKLSKTTNKLGKTLDQTTKTIYRDAKGIVKSEINSVNSLIKNPYTYLLIGGVILVILLAK